MVPPVDAEDDDDDEKKREGEREGEGEMGMRREGVASNYSVGAASPSRRVSRSVSLVRLSNLLPASGAQHSVARAATASRAQQSVARARSTASQYGNVRGVELSSAVSRRASVRLFESLSFERVCIRMV